MSSFGRFGHGQDHTMREFSICIKSLDGKVHARKRVLTVKSWSTVKDLKDILQSLLHLPAASQRLFFRGSELRNPHTLQDCGIYRDGQTVYLASSPQDEMGKPYSLEPFLGAGGLPRSLSRVLGQAKRGLDRGFKPELTLEGTGGTYFLQDAARQKVAVFKPQDEEPFAPNNPRDAMQGGLGGGTVSMRPGIDAGESYVREVAAYMLDDKHLHGVPATTLVEAKHPAFCYWDHKERKKLGSFQEFVRHDMVVEDISPSRLTPREVQKIALLDMRILNRDRNSVNILVRSRPRRSCSFSSERARGSRGGGGGGGGSACGANGRHDRNRHGSSDSNLNLSLSGGAGAGASSCGGGGKAGASRGDGDGLSDSGRGGGLSDSSGRGSSRRSGGLLGGSTEYELIPIDHGLCLSNELIIDWCDWCWLNWRQVKEPVDPELFSYIQSLDPEATAEKLGNTLNLQEPCLRNLRITETLLKEGVAAGLTLYDIACIIRREDFDKISELEALVARANELARAAVDHQTSVAPSKRSADLTSKSLDAANKPTGAGAARAPPGSVPAHRGSSSVDWEAEDKKDWFLAATTASHQEALAAGRAPPPPAQAPAFAAELSTDASSEENLPSLSDLRVSGDSVGSGNGSSGEGDGGGRSGKEGRPLRIWAPGAGNPAAAVAFAADGDGDSASPPRSAESDVELVSPKGFWREDFETIDARNATRRFSGWEDGAAYGKEDSPVVGVSAPGQPGGCSREGSGGSSSRADRAGGGRPPLRNDGGNPTALEDQMTDPGLAGGVKVGRKLFSSPEKPPPPQPPRRKTPPSGAVKPPKNASALPPAGSALEAMAEGDHESPSPMGPPGGGPHNPLFWASAVEPARDAGASGRGLRAEEKDGAAGPGAGAGAGIGWRRGEAGLLIPEPMPQPKPRSVTIQSVVPQRVARMGGEAQQGTCGGGGSGDAKPPLTAPRPATTSPTLPMPGEHKSKTPTELQQVLTPGVKIVRSYSYHGLGSIALYDSAKRGSTRYSLRKRPSENSEQFKVCFFRFLRFLLRDLVKRRHRTIVKERQAAEQQSSKLPSTSGAPPVPRSRGTAAAGYDADDPMQKLDDREEYRFRLFEKCGMAMTVDGSGDDRINLEGLDKPYSFMSEEDSNDEDDEEASETHNAGSGGEDDQRGGSEGDHDVEGMETRNEGPGGDSDHTGGAEGGHDGERMEDGDSSDEDDNSAASGQVDELTLVDENDSMDSDDEIQGMEIPDGFRIQAKTIMAQRVRRDAGGGAGGKRKRDVLRDISEEHTSSSSSCKGVSTRQQQASSASSTRSQQQAPRRPSPMAPARRASVRGVRRSRRVHDQQPSTAASASNNSGNSIGVGVRSGQRRARPAPAPAAAAAAAAATRRSCGNAAASAGAVKDGDEEGSMSCDEDLEGMVVDLSFEGVADEREEGGGGGGGGGERASRRGSTRSSRHGAEGEEGRARGTGGDRAAAAEQACSDREAAGGGGAAAAEREHGGEAQLQSRPASVATRRQQQQQQQQRRRRQQQQQRQHSSARIASAAAAALPPGVEDIDAGVGEEGDAHLLNPDYVKEHAAFLREQEKRNRPSAYIGTKQKDMRPGMRSVLVDWICEVCDQFKLSSRTLFQAVDLIDRSLSAFDVPRKKLQLLGCACVVLASKYEEIYAPTAEELAHISDNTYTRAEIIAMELVVVNALQFRLSCVTPCSFQDRFCRAAGSNARERSLVAYLQELLLQDYHVVTLLPSLKAAAALYLARQTLHPRGCPREAWTGQTEHYTGYRPRELEACVRRLHALHVRAEGNNLKAVRDKYKKPSLHCVAEVTCALEGSLYFGEGGD
eukprot:g2672.t1